MIDGVGIKGKHTWGKEIDDEQNDLKDKNKPASYA